ncbi:class II fructose-bisphosphate aldolase [Lihuaxuella thermophila]|uniref:Fructose-bisphosphate aldolase, class II/tagatose 1,6-diphosphate aldolase GatY/KbaY n=1 Tax=Lihuaxuella thermophila TaxID=1173111 RepID=A0A1H8CM44_9BACL|nr:class II fructose-bisphosphate aldolase [Lihuaxuella thermophila]SEM96105.1 fructose-bisphosphate aldolase, class II/tagatose 1,6-diphosphate aldolase GatY/KbaY [Lihuaxuella thermophila]
MALVTTREMLEDAYRNGYAVGAFGVHHLEGIRAVIAGAEALGAPVILATTPGTIRYVGIEYLASMAKLAAEQAKVPVALHLDHGNSLEVVKQCLKAGYTSIMIDGSRLPFAENVRLVREAVQLAKECGVPVEAELGTIGGTEDDLHVEGSKAMFTDPELAAEFVRKTGIDFLAPAFGTAHGKYKKEPKLDLQLLDEINRRVGIPLVMHGASGVPAESLQASLSFGISKVNFSTELKAAFVKELRNYLVLHPEEEDPRKYFIPARQAAERVVKEKISTISRKGATTC